MKKTLVLLIAAIFISTSCFAAGIGTTSKKDSDLKRNDKKRAGYTKPAKKQGKNAAKKSAASQNKQNQEKTPEAQETAGETY